MENKKKFSLLVLLSLFFFNSNSIFLMGNNYQQDIDCEVFKAWKKVEEFYTEGYLYLPTEKMVQKLYSLIPNQPAPASSDKFFPRLRFNRTLSIFHPDVALRLLNGPASWDYMGLLDGLSMLIRINPKLFMESIRRESDYFDQNRLFMIVNYIPEAYVFPETKQYLLEKRIESLELIKSSELESIKAKCLAQLQSKLDQIKRIDKSYDVARIEEEGDIFKQALISFTRRPDEIRARKIRDLIDISSSNEDMKASIISSLYYESREPKFDTFSLDTGISEEEWLHKKEYFLLEYEALTGNKYAGEILVRIWCLREPASLRIMNALGYLAKISPELYLEIMFPYQSKILKTFKEFPLSTFLNLFGEGSLRKLIDYEYLYTSLAKAKNDSYSGLKQLCLNQMLSSKENLKLSFFESGFKAGEYRSRHTLEITPYLSGERTMNSPSWENFKDKLTKFLKRPDENEGTGLLKAIPANLLPSEAKDDIWSLYDLYKYQAFQLFKYQMMIGNLPAIRCAIKLIRHTDTVEREVLLDALSLLARINPQALLEAFYLESSEFFLRENGYPVIYDLDLYKTSAESLTYELKMRRNAINLIQDEKLSQIKIQCLKKIQEMIKNYSTKLESGEEKFMYRPPLKIEEAVKEIIRLPNGKSMQRLKDVIKSQIRPDNEDINALLLISKNSMRNSSGYCGYKLPSDKYLLIEREALAGNKGAIELLASLYPQSYLFFKDILKDSLSKVAVIRPELFFEVFSKAPEIQKKDMVEIIGYMDSARALPPETDRKFILEQRINIIQQRKELRKNKFVMEILEDLKVGEGK